MDIGSGSVSRGKGALAGQLAGDALGSLVEFLPPSEIRRAYPLGLTKISGGGEWGTAAGQPTDDSEMALMLAESLVDKGTYSAKDALKRYRYWASTGPFDIGRTTSSALVYGQRIMDSQANGALMRISPLGVFSAFKGFHEVEGWAREDASLTHPNPVCLEVNGLYAKAVAFAVRTCAPPGEVFSFISEASAGCSAEVRGAVESSSSPPPDFMRNQGWVLTAFRNALYHLRSGSDPFRGVVETVMSGGDTDTNGAICGALLGACHGIESFPDQWLDALRKCTPERIRARSRHPRPAVFSPCGFESLAERLLL